jgi:hypothetical protein
MKWFCLLAVAGSLPLCATVHKRLISFEEKIRQLEQDSGIEVRKETTTVSFFGEFIYWKASLDGVAYATTAKVVDAVGGGTLFDKFKTRTVHFDFDPAFQIGMGIGLPYDYWDVSWRWLRSRTKGEDLAHGDLEIVPPNRIIIDSVGMIENLEVPPRRAKAKCKVDLDIADLVLGRTFLWSRYFSFRPYAGFRGAWLKLDWDIAFQMPFSIPSANIQNRASLDVDNDFSAGGFVGGFESKWDLYQGFGFFSNASAALVYGRSSERTKEKFVLVPADALEESEQTLTARNSINTVKGMFNILLGLKWEGDFYKTYHLMAWAGYDFFYWPNVTQKTINQAIRSRDRADLSYQGLVVGARFIF